LARNRRRAADRKGRGRPEGDGVPEGDGAPDERLHREEQPGSLDHASGEVDEVEAAIVAGADGEPLTPDAEDPDDEALEDEALAQAPRREVAAPAAAGAPTSGRGGGRFLNFLRASWAELKRVQWPDRRQVGQATAVVLGFVVVAGAFLGLIDALAKQVVDLII
jgi:preprotein translocase SecE subunit